MTQDIENIPDKIVDMWLDQQNFQMVVDTCMLLRFPPGPLKKN